MAVICSMNRVTGTHSCQNSELLMNKLKTQLGFPGFVYPDESAQFSSYGAANAGLDYSPYADGMWSCSAFSAGLANGSLTQARLNDMAIRTALPYYYIGIDKETFTTVTSDYSAYRDVRGNHSSLIRKVGGESLSLLKNNNKNGGGLPLNKPHSISLYGAHAGPGIIGPNHLWSVSGTTSDVYQGHLAQGGGSGQTSLPYLITPFNSITERAVKDNTALWWIINNSKREEEPLRVTTSNSVVSDAGTGNNPNFKSYAKVSDFCLCFINSWSGEGADRSLLYDQEQDNMVNKVASECNNTIVVVNVSGPRVLNAWAEHENVTAIIYGGLLGQESGNAIADVLYGDVNPSGRLIHTIAKNQSDYPAGICETASCPFSEGVYKHIELQYPFGHGLSYTTFSYSDVAAKVTNQSALSSKYPTGKLGLGGEADLFNDVVQQPVRILRRFEKVTISSGDSAEIQFSLRRRDLSHWDVSAQKWAIASGKYTFSVGASSGDLRGNATLTI
ncbi:hypothetical protein N7488_003571 [Penicillium malachiteum]|nr:hypothetical protein N7488_003571 [Penicillium malachiteum]